MSRDYDIILDIMRLAREQRSILTDADKKLTPSGSAVLVALSEKDGVSATDIANSMGYEKPFVTHVIKGLVAESYVSVSKVDGRTACISITDKGRKAAVEIKEKLCKFVDLLFQDCSAEERDTLRQNIRRMVESKSN